MKNEIYVIISISNLFQRCKSLSIYQIDPQVLKYLSVECNFLLIGIIVLQKPKISLGSIIPQGSLLVVKDDIGEPNVFRRNTQLVDTFVLRWVP